MRPPCLFFLQENFKLFVNELNYDFYVKEYNIEFGITGLHQPAGNGVQRMRKYWIPDQVGNDIFVCWRCKSRIGCEENDMPFLLGITLPDGVEHGIALNSASRRMAFRECENTGFLPTNREE